MNDFTTNPLTLISLISLIPVIVFFVMALNLSRIRKTVVPDHIQLATIYYVLGQKEQSINEIAKAINTPGTRARVLFDNVIASTTEEGKKIAVEKFNEYFNTFFVFAGITPDFSKVCPNLQK